LFQVVTIQNRRSVVRQAGSEAGRQAGGRENPAGRPRKQAGSNPGSRIAAGRNPRHSSRQAGMHLRVQVGGTQVWQAPAGRQEPRPGGRHAVRRQARRRGGMGRWQESRT